MIGPAEKSEVKNLTHSHHYDWPLTILGWPIGQIDEPWAGIQYTETALQYWDLEQGSKLELRCANLNLKLERQHRRFGSATDALMELVPVVPFLSRTMGDFK